MRYSALVLAAGSGQRMKLGYNKVFYELENGKHGLRSGVIGFQEDDRCKQIVLVCSTQMISFGSLHSMSAERSSLF